MKGTFTAIQLSDKMVTFSGPAVILSVLQTDDALVSKLVAAVLNSETVGIMTEHDYDAQELEAEQRGYEKAKAKMLEK